METTQSQVPSSASTSARLVEIFISYRRSDGDWHAEWLHRHLEGLEYVDNSGQPCILKTYYDKTAAGVDDWKLQNLGALRTARAMLLVCTPGIAQDLSKRKKGSDSLYAELKWWVRQRGVAPIVVDPKGDGHLWLPKLLTVKWPHINRIHLSSNEAESADPEYQLRLIDRIVGAIRELEQQTLAEDLAQSLRQERRLRWALTAASILLSVSIILGLYANERRRESNEKTRLAEESLTVAAGFLMRLLQYGRPGQTTSLELIKLITEVRDRADETQFVTVALQVLSCWGLASIQSQLVHDAMVDMYAAIESSASGREPEVQSRIATLKANTAAARSGSEAPHPCMAPTS
ncbi:MAG: hypothetical protein AAGA68_18315 [Pseudomonadota bacterium]